MNNKEIVKYFYEDVVSKNLIDEAAHFLSAEDVEEMCQHLIAVRNTYPDYTMSITRQFEDVEFRKALPKDYKLFQAADMICTMELLSLKLKNEGLSKSELTFFGNTRDLKRNYLRQIKKLDK